MGLLAKINSLLCSAVNQPDEEFYTSGLSRVELYNDDDFILDVAFEG